MEPLYACLEFLVSFNLLQESQHWILIFFCFGHALIQGTSRPAHYHVLIDEIGFAVDELQQFIHNLSYVYARNASKQSQSVN